MKTKKEIEQMHKDILKKFCNSRSEYHRLCLAKLEVFEEILQIPYEKRSWAYEKN